MTAASTGTPGAWKRWGPVFIVVSVLCLLGGAYLLDHAAPQTPNLFDKRWDAPVRREWDLGLARIGASLLAAAAGTAGIGLLVRVLLGGDAGRDGQVRALLVLGVIGALATAWIRWSGPFG